VIPLQPIPPSEEDSKNTTTTPPTLSAETNTLESNTPFQVNSSTLKSPSGNDLSLSSVSSASSNVNNLKLQSLHHIRDSMVSYQNFVWPILTSAEHSHLLLRMKDFFFFGLSKLNLTTQQPATSRPLSPVLDLSLRASASLNTRTTLTSSSSSSLAPPTSLDETITDPPREDQKSTMSVIEINSDLSEPNLINGPHVDKNGELLPKQTPS